MNVWGRSLRLHIPLKDIFLMHYLAPILNNAISRREVILTSRHFEFDRYMDNKRKIIALLMGLSLGGQSVYAQGYSWWQRVSVLLARYTQGCPDRCLFQRGSPADAWCEPGWYHQFGGR